MEALNEYSLGRIIGIIGIYAWAGSMVIAWQGFNKNKLVLYSNVVVAFVLFIGGLVLYPKKLANGINSNAAGVLFTPMLFMILHYLSGRAYYFLYGFPPDSGVYTSNTAKGTNRKLNFFDHVVVFLPAVLSLTIGITLSRM